MPTAKQLKHLGQFIRKSREDKGWTLKDLHEKSGIGYSYVSNIERGYINPKRGPVTPSDDVLTQIAETLGVSAGKLHSVLGRDENADSASPAAALLRNTRAAQQAAEGGEGLTEEVMDALIDQIERFAEFSVAQEAQKQGKA